MGEIWVKVEMLSPLLHQTSKHIIFFLKFLCFNSYLYGSLPPILPECPEVSVDEDVEDEEGEGGRQRVEGEGD